MATGETADSAAASELPTTNGEPVGVLNLNGMTFDPGVTEYNCFFPYWHSKVVEITPIMAPQSHCP